MYKNIFQARVVYTAYYCYRHMESTMRYNNIAKYKTQILFILKITIAIKSKVGIC